MGLTSSLDKIISFTSKFNDSLNLQKLLNVNVPGIDFGKYFGRNHEQGTQTLGDLVGQIEEIGGDIMTGANLIRCATVMNMSDWENFLGQMSMGVTSIIASIADQIINELSLQIGNAIQQIVNTITSIADALYNVWVSIELLIDSIGDLWDNWTTDIDFDIDFELNERNCKDMYAAIAGCFLNKFVGSYLDEFREKALNEINKGGNKLNDMLYDELSDARTFAAYANHEAFLLQKAKLQIQGLTKENLTK